MDPAVSGICGRTRASYVRSMFNAESSRPHALEDRTAQGSAGLAIDSISLLRDGQRWFPVMGEYHFSRDDPERWEHELRKMKAGGITVVATYVLWIVHEEERGSRGWDRHLDLRRFVETAQRVGLDVVMRVGPWAHGEARNGGFPDWLQALPIAHRTNDPAYLELVRSWYADIAAQLDGLFRDDHHPTAPIIAIQVDNELYDQPEHLATLRDLAEEAGMRAPFWVATGWGGAQVPLDKLIPVYAGYSDGFWEESNIEAPDFARMHFVFSDMRDDLSVGADVREAGPTSGVDDSRFPFLTCELGGGMAVAYHRRPLVDSSDIAALALTKLGSGSAWQGYYVYHGTVQVTGELTGMQESHESGYPNELPMKDYDFYAPIGSAGTLRAHYHKLRKQHLFLHEWGAQLLALPTEFPDAAVTGLRTAVRLSEGRGYVFGNNHQPASSPLADAEHFQLSWADEGRTLTLPSRPIRVPAGEYFVWPVRQRYGDVLELSGTIQPITQIATEAGLVVIFGANRGIDVELEIDSGGTPISGAHPVETPSGVRWVPARAAGAACVISVGSTRLVILDPDAADTVWKSRVADAEVVALWDGGLTVEEDALVVERWAPTDDILTIPAAVGAVDTVGVFHRLPLAAPSLSSRLTVTAVAPATGAPETRYGGSMGRLSAPRDDEFDRAAVFEITVPFDPDFGGAQVLSLDWRGDVARAYVGDELVSDQFWHGRSWELDVRRLPGLRTSPLRIEVLPWNGDADFYVDGRVRSQRVPGRADILSAELVRAARAPIAFTAAPDEPAPDVLE